MSIKQNEEITVDLSQESFTLLLLSIRRIIDYINLLRDNNISKEMQDEWDAFDVETSELLIGLLKGLESNGLEVENKEKDVK